MSNDASQIKSESRILRSALYTGKIRHRRNQPKKHVFNYHVFMVYLDLDELDSVLSKSFFWSDNWWALSRFRRSDFHGDPDVPLKRALHQTIEDRSGTLFDGSICMLSNWRYFGINMNPLTTYYCFDRNDRLSFILAEVNNTPWNERHTYFLDCRKLDGTEASAVQGDMNTLAAKGIQKLEQERPTKKRSYRFGFDKAFSVSPFHPIDMKYDWTCTEPGKALSIHIENSLHDQLVFDATLSLKREEISKYALNGILIRYPFMTVKVVLAIYWEALLLFVKGVPFLGKDRLSSGGKLK